MAVPVPRAALMAGSRGPHAETVIPPSPNAVVTDHRQRPGAGRPVPAMAAVTGTPPPALAEPTPAGHRFRPGGPLTGDDGLTTTTRSASPQNLPDHSGCQAGPRRKPFSPSRRPRSTWPWWPGTLTPQAMRSSLIRSHLPTMTRRWPEAGAGRLAVVRKPDWQPHISMLDFASELAELRPGHRITGCPARPTTGVDRLATRGYARTGPGQLAAPRRGPRGSQSRLPRTRRLPGLTRPDARTVDPRNT